MNEQEPQGLDLQRIVAILSKWRWIIIVLTGVAVLTAAFLSEFVLAKVYQAQSTVDVSYAAPEQNQQTTLPSQGIQGVLQAEATLPQDTLETYEFEVTNPTVLQATIQALAAKGVVLSTDALSKMTKVSLVTNTNLINVDVSATSPTEAALVANTLTSNFLSFVQNEDQQKLNQAVGFLQQQTKGVQTQLAAATAALAAAENSDGNSQASSELTADTSELNTLQDQLIQGQISLQSAEAGRTALQQQLTATPPTITTDTPSSATSASAGSSSGASTTSRQTKTEPNPVYQSLSQQLATQKVTVAEDQATVSELQGQVNTLLSKIKTLSNQVQGEQGTIASLQANVQELTKTYQTLSENLVQTQVADSVSLGSAVVTQVAVATPPIIPIKPKKKLDVVLAFVLGLVISVGLAFILEQMDTKLKTPEDVERLVHLPTLAVIPHVLD